MLPRSQERAGGIAQLRGLIVAAELYDLRAKVTTLGHCALAAYSRAHDIDKSEVVRDIIEAWARKQIHGAKLLESCLKAKGVTAAEQGITGNAGETLDWGES